MVVSFLPVVPPFPSLNGPEKVQTPCNARSLKENNNTTSRSCDFSSRIFSFVVTLSSFRSTFFGNPFHHLPLNFQHTSPSLGIYLPGRPPCAIAAFCSWNLSPSLSELLRNLSTQRMTQPSSLESRDLEVKSCTQSVKQRCTRFEYICEMRKRVRSLACWRFERWPGFALFPSLERVSGETYVHEVLHLLALHAALQLALLGGVQPVARGVVSYADPFVSIIARNA